MALTKTTYSQSASLQFQDKTISPATLADGTLRQRFDPHAFPQKGIKYAGTLGDALVTPVLTRGTILTTGGTFGTGVAVPALTKSTTATSGGTFGAGDEFWVITAITATGETTASNEITATLLATGTQVMTWVAIAGATGYKVYRGTSTGVHGTLVATLGAVTTYTDTGIAGTSASPPTNEGTYYWKVVAVNEEGAHAVSNEISAICSPSGGDVLPAGTVAMSWPAVVDDVTYKVYRGTAPGAEGRLVYTGTGLSFVDTGAAGTAAAVPTGNTTGITVPAAARTTHGSGS